MTWAINVAANNSNTASTTDELIHNYFPNVFGKIVLKGHPGSG